jgi:hypothetical protein
MKKNLLFIAGLLAVNLSSSISAFLFIGVNQTQNKLGVTISLADGTSQYLTLQPYGQNGYINADLNVNNRCIKNVVIQKLETNSAPIAFTLYGEDGCQNLQLEFKQSSGILSINKAPYYGYRNY